MKILTNRNGIALVAVLTLLLVLTMLLPAMFTMSESATKSAMRGKDEQRASYLARSMLEMSVSAFQEIYDAAEEEEKSLSHEDLAQPTTDYSKLQVFYNTTKNMDASTLYMYRNPSVAFEEGNVSDDYKEDGVYYSTTAPTNGKLAIAGTEYQHIGTASCKITYDNTVKYYKITENAEGEIETTDATKNDYDTYITTVNEMLAKNESVSTLTAQYTKVQNKNVVFSAVGTINGKSSTRRCIMVLPTKPSEESWIVPANIESNQIFPNTKKATSVVPLSNNEDADEEATGQPVYVFSCIGNMVISPENLKAIKTDANGNKMMEGDDYVYVDFEEVNPNFSIKDLSLGTHPVTTTINPENDPTFSCIKTNNMSSWYNDAQLDNFIAFTATNAIQVDMPINLLINPCRTGRIGDGLAANHSLYKILYFQAPTIVFNGSVNNFISLYQKTVLGIPVSGYNAYRMSTVILSAPDNTPYSYDHPDPKYGGRTVKAGKVIFAEDSYIWLVPFTEDGSNYKTQTVYYKGKDINLYKFASAGDVFLFNTEVLTEADGTTQQAGFSLTAYFMDVLYEQGVADDEDTPWYEFWNSMKEVMFKEALARFGSEDTYVEGDLKKIGNIYTSNDKTAAVVDDFYVVWES